MSNTLNTSRFRDVPYIPAVREDGVSLCAECRTPLHFRQEAWGDVTACPTCQIRHFWSIGD